MMQIAMRFLSVAERELRAAARRNRTYYVRWLTGLSFFGLLLWLFWVFDGFRNRNAAPDVFQVLSVLTFIYCLFVGTAVTADCISAEKREGTLGLLFLTNLNSAEIIAGKLCSSALVTVYGLFAVFPMLGLLLLFGGITLEHFWQTVLALVNAIFFAVAAGFVASVVCVRQFTAVALATGLALVFGVGLLGAAAIVHSQGGPRIWVDGLALICPLYPLVSADGSRVFGQNHYWLSLALGACLSLGWLVLVTLRLSRAWQDRPNRMRLALPGSLWGRWRALGSGGRVKLRRRLLDRNPFFWLGARQIVSAPFFMLLAVILVAVTVYIMAPFFERMLRAGTIGPLAGFAFAWMWMGLAIHALVLYYAAMISSQRLAEDRQSGALELILSTPVTEQFISRGFWLAYWRRMFFPVLVAVSVHLFFIWQGATIFVFEVDEVPRGITPGQLLWRAFWKLPVSGKSDDWSFWLALRMLLLVLVLAAVIWLTLGWLGRWLGVRMKHPGFAPLVALGLVFIPPILLFSVFCYVAGELKFFRLPERWVIPILMWTAFGIGALNCLVLSRWAATRLRWDLRATVTGRFSSPRPRFWWLPSRRTVLRSAATATALMAVVALLVLAFYGRENRHSRRAWTEFQRQLAQRSETLEVAALLPGPVPDNENFARTDAFKSFTSGSDTETKRLFDALQPWETLSGGYGNSATFEWVAQGFTPLAHYAARITPGFQPGMRTNRIAVAPVILQGLQSQAELLRNLSVAARLPFLQFSTNRDALVVLQSDQRAISALERMHFLFCLRACASLAASQASDAGEDLLTSLHLARLARQLPEARTTARVQGMLARSFQPLWEGLASHQWTESQLAAFQTELLRFDLLADYTNAVRRVVLAHIDNWRAYPDAKSQPRSVPIAGNGYIMVEGWQFRPRTWWFDGCIQLYQAGERAVAQVDVAGQTVRPNSAWNDLQGLPLGGDTEQFIGQYRWWWPTTPALLAFAQNALNQAVLACALERFYLANGNYPETLSQLTPDYLQQIPNDIVRGRPMIYQGTDDDRYVLRGVGQNEKDDRKLKTSDDWLWWYGTNVPPIVPPLR